MLYQLFAYKLHGSTFYIKNWLYLIFMIKYWYCTNFYTKNLCCLNFLLDKLQYILTFLSPWPPVATQGSLNPKGGSYCLSWINAMLSRYLSQSSQSRTCMLSRYLSPYSQSRTCMLSRYLSPYSQSRTCMLSRYLRPYSQSRTCILSRYLSPCSQSRTSMFGTGKKLCSLNDVRYGRCLNTNMYRVNLLEIRPSFPS